MTTIYSKAGADAAISAATDALTPEDVGADPAGTAAAAIAALGLGTAAQSDATDFAPASSAAYPVQQVTLTGDLAYTLPAGAPVDRVISVVFTQDGTGGHTVTHGGAPVDVDTTPGAATTVELHPVGAGYAVRYPSLVRGGGGTVFYGSTASTARPATPNPVIWIGHTGVIPTNAIADFDMTMTFDAPVTTFADSFADGSGALPPAGWTNAGWNTTSVASWNEGAGFLTIVKQAAASWATKMDAFTITGNVDVVTKVSTDNRIAGSYHCGIIAGGSGSESARAGTVAYLRKDGYVFLSEYVNNVIQTGTEVLAPAWDAANTIVYIRLNITGTTAKVKVWKEADSEPAGWLATYTVTPKAGWVGIFSAGDRTSKIYYYAASKSGNATLE